MIRGLNDRNADCIQGVIALRDTGRKVIGQVMYGGVRIVSDSRGKN